MSKTFNRQTAKFLAVLAENVPTLSGDEMQEWIQDPKELQKLLSGLSLSATPNGVSLSEIKGVGRSFEDYSCLTGSVSFSALEKQPTINYRTNYPQDSRAFVYFTANAEKEYRNLEEGPVPRSCLTYDYFKGKISDSHILKEEISDDSVYKGQEGCKIMWANIVRLLKEQVGGKAGHLLNNGKNNIFYYQEPENYFHYVCISWDASHNRWLVKLYRVCDILQRPGVRVFSNSKP